VQIYGITKPKVKKGPSRTRGESPSGGREGPSCPYVLRPNFLIGTHQGLPYGGRRKTNACHYVYSFLEKAVFFTNILPSVWSIDKTYKFFLFESKFI
jgi:hypothetical protein